MQIGKEPIKNSLFADYMILYLKDPKTLFKNAQTPSTGIARWQDKKSTYKNPYLFYTAIMNKL
jgi:hypothetical protein